MDRSTIIKSVDNLENSAVGGINVDLSSADHVLHKPARCLYVGGTGGDVKVKHINGSVVTYYDVPVGTILPVAITTIYKTGTASGAKITAMF